MNKSKNSAVKQCLIDCGYNVDVLKYIPEGSNHDVYFATLKDGQELVAKFSSARYTEVGITDKNEDTLFGGQLSLEREEALYHLVRETLGLPAPKTYGIHNCDMGQFIMVEKMPGISHKQYLEKIGHSKISFLSSMVSLGRDFAKAHQLTFASYGNIMADAQIEPVGLDNFCSYFYPIIKRRIKRANTKGAFSKAELQIVEDFYQKEFDKYYDYLSIKKSPPTIIFTDMHGDNFFVDDDGTPCGYFDLESCQAAPAALEFYGLRFFIFNYYDAETIIEAEKAFFVGYTSAGGKFAPKTSTDHSFIDFLSSARLLELTDSYWGYIDGLRDTWGQRIKDLLFNYISEQKMDYTALADIFRERDKQPNTPK